MNTSLSKDSFSDAGEIRQLMLTQDWSQTLLNPPSQWLQSLRTAVSLILNSHHPMFIWWGQDYTHLYNDAYGRILGTGKHPQFFGRSAIDCWPEMWDQVGELAKAVLLTGQPTSCEHLMLMIDRDGLLEERYFTFDYSAIFDESGGVGGILGIVTETTEQIIAERRLQTLQKITIPTTHPQSIERIYHHITDVITSNPRDIPFALIYRTDNGKQAELVTTTGLKTHPFIPLSTIDLTQESDPWQLTLVDQTKEALLLNDLNIRFETLLIDPGNELCQKAMIFPLNKTDQSQSIGFLILGISPHRQFDQSYREFLDLMANQVKIAIANLQTHIVQKPSLEPHFKHHLKTQVINILESMTDGFVSVDCQWRLTFMNSASERLFQHQKEQLLGNNLWEIYPQFMGSISEQKLHQAMDNQRTDYFESFSIDTETWYEIHAYPYQQGLVIYWRDITEQKQSAVALQESEERFRVAQELSLDAFTILQSIRDETGKIIDFEWKYVNPKAAQLLHQPVEALVNQRLLKMLPGNKTNSDLFERYVQVVETGKPHDIELCYQSEGIIGWFRNMSVKIGDGVAISFSDISKRKLAEEALRQSEERLRVALKSAPITLFNQDKKLNYTWIYNPVFYQFKADYTSLDEIIGRSDFDLLPHEQASKLVQLKRQVLETGQGTRQEVSLIIQDQEYYFDLTIEPLCNINHEIVGITCAAVDISQQKQVEFALRQSETVLNTFLSSSPIGLALFDQNLRYLYANETLANLNGCSLNQHRGRMLGEVIPNMVDEFIPLLEKVIQTREPVLNYEYIGQVYLGDEIHHCLANHFPVFLPDGEIIGVGVTVMNITDLKRTEAALRESEALANARAEELKTFMETVPAAVWIAHDPQCHQMTANRAAYQLVQLPSGAVVTATPSDGSYPFAFKIQQNGVEIPLQDLPMQTAGRTGEDQEAELEFVFPHGEIRFIYGRAVPLRDEVGEIRGVIGVFIDVSDRRRAEQEREQLLIREQTAREEAEAANRIKDEFLAVLSHELRSPLNPILGWTKLLQTRKFDAQGTARALETIERNAKLQTQLIEDLLDISRILRGKLVLNMEPVNLIIIIESALETVKLAAEAKGIQVNFEVISSEEMDITSTSQVWIKPSPIWKSSSCLIYVLGDSARLQQVMWNLLSNAIKFTPSGGVVKVQLKCRENQAYIQVQDTGKGINSEFLPFVFDYFRQEDSTTTRKFGGLGLGLAIVRHLTELHGGTVSADSLGEGQGAVFEVQLPLMEYEIKPYKPYKNKIEGRDLTGLRILVVDDEADLRELVEFILEQSGAEVRVANSGREALGLIAEFSPHVLVSDIGMPEMDGYGLIAEVRKTSSIPAIALTAYAGETNQALALASGFQLHLAKPIEPDELVLSIANLTQKTI